MNPDHPKSTVVAQWRRLAATIHAVLAQLPAGQEPDLVPVSPGDEWKTGAQREAAEEAHDGPVLAAFAQWRETMRWPKLEPTTAFFVADRLAWAARFAELLATLPHAGAPRTAQPSFPLGSCKPDAIHWLAVQVYDQYRPSSLRRWRDRTRMDDYA